jgi:hypothetical protein
MNDREAEGAMTQSVVPEALWDEFHSVVNMTSDELADWLRAEAEREDADRRPDQDGARRIGLRVLQIMDKGRGDVNARDRMYMRTVVQAVATRNDGWFDTAHDDDAWRRRLMCLGHDPRRPAAH